MIQGKYLNTLWYGSKLIWRSISKYWHRNDKWKRNQNW